MTYLMLLCSLFCIPVKSPRCPYLYFHYPTHSKKMKREIEIKINLTFFFLINFNTWINLLFLFLTSSSSPSSFPSFSLGFPYDFSCLVLICFRFRPGIPTGINYRPPFYFISLLGYLNM